jgi:hypothetical protein
MSNLSEIEHEVEAARGNLSRTLDEVNRKAAYTGSELRIPEQQIRRFPFSSMCGAMALGLAAGGSPGPAMLLGVIALGSALMGPKVCERSQDQLGHRDGINHGID